MADPQHPLGAGAAPHAQGGVHPRSSDPLLFPEPVARHRLGGISRRKMSQLIRDGEIAVVRIGRRVFFTPESLQKFIADRTEGRP